VCVCVWIATRNLQHFPHNFPAYDQNLLEDMCPLQTALPMSSPFGAPWESAGCWLVDVSLESMAAIFLQFAPIQQFNSLLAPLSVYANKVRWRKRCHVDIVKAISSHIFPPGKAPPGGKHI